MDIIDIADGWPFDPIEQDVQIVDTLEKSIKKFEENLQKKDIIKKINLENSYAQEMALDFLKRKSDCGFIKYDADDIEDLGVLEQEFFNLAISLIYGGYLVVSIHERILYKIYIDCAEFYFNCKGNSNIKELNVKDPVLNYRNKRYKMTEIPLSSTISLCLTKSGCSISFRYKNSNYCVSALISTYSITDEKYHVSVRDQVTKNLYVILNECFIEGRRDGETPVIIWKDRPYGQRKYKDLLNLLVSYRYNVFVSSNTDSYLRKEYKAFLISKKNRNLFVKKPKSNLYYKKDLRLWQFRRIITPYSPLPFLDN